LREAGGISTESRMARLVQATAIALCLAFVVGVPALAAAPDDASATPRAKKVSIAAKRVQGRSVVFVVKRCCLTGIGHAAVRTGRYYRKLKVRRVRRAVRRGVIRVWLPRKARRITAQRKRRTRLTLLVARNVKQPAPAPAPQPAPGPVNGWVGGMETGGFSEFDSFSTWEGQLAVAQGSAYDGTHAAHAAFAGNGESGGQRAWKQVSWSSGSDVWYGMALQVPDAERFCYWNPIRWDNYKTYGGTGDVGGLSIEDGRLNVIQNHYGEAERRLISGPAVPEGRWFWVEIHQRLSDTDGQALSELYVDGRLVGSSTAANSAGRQIDHLRFGVVNVAGSCSKPGTVDFDRASISDGMRGPAV
jgi:hypothetical protein